MNEPEPAWDVSRIREQFPGLARQVAGRPAVSFDGPAGSQVPRAVAQAVTAYLLTTNANHGGLFATSRESDALLDRAHQVAAAFVGAADPDEVAFGANMTTLTFALSRALARTWQPGDEVVVTRLDHDANVMPWVLAARDAGAVVRHADIHPDDCTLDLDDLRAKLGSRTRLVAVGCASNAVGTINPVKQIAAWAHAAGAQVFLDAVHYAPHGLLDVRDWGCDYLACSAYKFFGPHVGLLWGRRELLEELPAYKVRPAPDTIPGRWMTGTPNLEGIAGTLAAVGYLAGLGGWDQKRPSDLRPALRRAYQLIESYERDLCRRLLEGLARLPAIKVWGVTDLNRFAERVPTVGLTHARLTATHLAAALAERGVFVWHGNFYALALTERLGLEPEGMVRIGLLHYNTAEEVDRLLDTLAEFS